MGLIFTPISSWGQGLVETLRKRHKALSGYVPEKLLGNYPYGKFAIVENFFPNGIWHAFFFYPAGEHRCKDYLHRGYLPLGHEILLHNWWGKLGLCR